jgi:hypothetical protein
MEVGVLPGTDHLAVDDRSLAPELRRRGDDSGIDRRPVVAVARPRPCCAAVDDKDGAVAVVLLVNPAVHRRRLGNQRRQRGRNEGGLTQICRKRIIRCRSAGVSIPSVSASF